MDSVLKMSLSIEYHTKSDPPLMRRRTRLELGIFKYSTGNSMSNLSSYCGLVDARIRASEKDLPVIIQGRFKEQVCFFFGQNWRGTCTPSSAGPATTY